MFNIASICENVFKLLTFILSTLWAKFFFKKIQAKKKLINWQFSPNYFSDIFYFSESSNQFWAWTFFKFSGLLCYIKLLSAVSRKNVLNVLIFFRFFNPLHSKPTGEGVAPETKSKGVLYDLDGKFAYSTYSEEMRSYHPMLDIRELTKDLK